MPNQNQQKNSNHLGLLSAGSAVSFVLMIGLVSLFADTTYEGGRSLIGQYLKLLGSNATVVGFVAGAGSLLGYSLRLVSGYIADKSQKYWLVALVGYVINLFSLPMLAFVGQWEVAVIFIFLERIGKAIRNPSRDAMLSYATHKMGRGWGFGVHEAMDQIGSVLGPLLMAGVLSWRGTGPADVGRYQFSFQVLFISAVVAMLVLAAARFLFPNPQELEDPTPEVAVRGFDSTFWWYMGAIGLIGLGFAEFPLMAFHFKTIDLAPDAAIPVFYAIGMAVDGVAALVFGKLYDRHGIPVLIGVFGAAAFFAPLAFLGTRNIAVLGVALWGVGMGAAESILRVPIAEMVSRDRRAQAYGTYHFALGVSLFAGGALIGWLYDQDLIPVLVVFSVLIQLAALPILWKAGRRDRASSSP
jgi:MFS family permease